VPIVYSILFIANKDKECYRKEVIVLEGRLSFVLKAIVEEYVQTAEPVGSKTLVNRPEFRLNFSSATIRNDMVELENLGLITKTHFSSGRIPSESGYREYVKIILEENSKSIESFPLLDEIFQQEFITREKAVKESVAILTNLTDYAAFVLGTQGYNAVIKKLQIYQVSPKNAVILMITDQGYVESRIISLPQDIRFSEIEKVIYFLDNALHNVPISKIDEVLKEKFTEEKVREYFDFYDDLLSGFVRVFTNMAQDRYFMEGKTNILNQPEFRDIEKAKSLIDALESGEILKDLFVNDNGISISIGHDNRVKAMQNCTIISVPYEMNDGDRGAIAILGPTRMEYHKVIPLLEYIAKNIAKIK